MGGTDREAVKLYQLFKQIANQITVIKKTSELNVPLVPGLIQMFLQSLFIIP